MPEVTEDLQTEARAALESGRECARRWHGAQGEERAAALDASISVLQDARRPLTAYCRRGPQVGRRVSDDPIRALNRDVDDCLRKLRDMRRRHPGNSRNRRRRVKRDQLVGMIYRASQTGLAIRAEHDAIRSALARGTPRTMPNGGVILSTAELNEEAKNLLVRLDRLRGQLDRKWQLWAEGQDAREQNTLSPWHERDDYNDLEAKVVRLRGGIAQLRAKIAASATQAVPDAPDPVGHVYGERWTLEDAIIAWLGFFETKGRWPRKIDHGRDRLPTYNQLRRLAGPSPITQMLDLVADATIEERP